MTYILGSIEDKLTAAFSIFDIDADDKITKQEFKLIFGYLEKIQKTKKDEHKKSPDYTSEYEDAFDEIDVNKNGTISLEEFKTGLQSQS